MHYLPLFLQVIMSDPIQQALRMVQKMASIGTTMPRKALDLRRQVPFLSILQTLTAAAVAVGSVGIWGVHLVDIEQDAIGLQTLIGENSYSPVPAAPSLQRYPLLP